MSVSIFLSNTYDMAATNVFRTLQAHTGIGQHNIVLVPDKYTLSVESKLLERLRIDCTFDVEVMSFTRLAAKSMRDKINRCLTPEGSVILLRQAVQDVKKQLTVYTAAADVAGFPREVYAAVTAMRNGGIFPDDLLFVTSASETAAKLKDVGLIYQRYLELLENRLSDSSTRLYAFADSIPLSDEFTDTNFYITDFSDFTAPQYDIIEKLIACSNSVTVGLVTAKGANNARLSGARALNRIKAACNACGIIPSITENDEILPDYKTQLLRNLFSYKDVKPVDIKRNEICLFDAPNADAEIENIAKIIRRGVIEKNLRYKDFAVVVSDGEGYKSIVKNVFTRYGIPYFFDDKIIFSGQPTAKFILSAMRCAATDFDYVEVNGLVKNPLFYLDGDGYEDVEYFDDFVTEFSLGRQLKKPFSDTRAETVRKKLIHTVSPFYKMSTAPALDFAAALEKFSAINDLYDKCESISENGQNAETRAAAQSYDKFMAVIDEMKVTLSNEPMSLNDFIILAEGVFGNIKIALVPLYLDSVYVGEPDESRYDDIKNLFVVGALDGKLPRSVADTAVIGLSEEAEMIACGLQPYPTKKEILKNNCLSLIHLLLKPSRQLIISYPENYGGAEAMPSTLIQQIKVLFTDNGKEFEPRKVTNDLLNDASRTDKERAAAYAYKFSTMKNGLFELLGDVSSESVRPVDMAPYDAMAALLSAPDRAKIDSLLTPESGKEKIDGNISLDRGYFSASQMETYFACPYKQYFRYALTVKPRKDGKLTVKETGTLSHYVMEQFIRGGYYENFDKDKVERLIKSWIDERINESDMLCFRAKKHINTFTRLRGECLQLCEGIARQIAKSQFKPYVSEAKIGKMSDGSKFDGMEAEIDGKKYYLYGSIDRIDCCDGYFTVVDYKSSDKNLDLGAVYNGTKIQPLLYLSAVDGDDNLRFPAGLLYQPISVGYKKEDDGRFAMKGIVIDDLSVLSKMDTELNASVKSDFLPVKIKKDGTVTKNSSAVSDTVLTSLKLYSEKLTKRAVGEIADGFITPAPVKNACEFCDYSPICVYADDEKFMRKSFPVIKEEDFIKLYNGETVGANEAEEVCNE